MNMVSVILPTYNRAEVIGRAIESVLRQTYTDLELVIVDDGSSDDTKAVVGDFHDSRIRYIQSDKRMGANASRNIGIRNAGGEYIAFQDSDDKWKSDKLEKQMKLFEANSGLGVVYSRYMRHTVSGEKVLIPHVNYTKEMLQEEILHTLAFNNVIGTPTMVVKKKCFDECGMFDEKLPRFQDWEINIRLAGMYSFGLVDEVLVDAYEMEQSITNSKRSYIDGIAYITKKHYTFFEEQGYLNKLGGVLAKAAMEEKRLEELRDLLGDKLFFSALYAYGEKNINIQKNYSFTKHWLVSDTKGEIINSMFESYSDGSIVLYGLGDMGGLLLNKLTPSNKEKIKFIIDQNRYKKTEYSVIPLENLTVDDFSGIECIIITAIAHEAVIREKLDGMTKAQIISLRDIL